MKSCCQRPPAEREQRRGPQAPPKSAESLCTAVAGRCPMSADVRARKLGHNPGTFDIRPRCRIEVDLIGTETRTRTPNAREIEARRRAARSANSQHIARAVRMTPNQQISGRLHRRASDQAIDGVSQTRTGAERPSLGSKRCLQCSRRRPAVPILDRRRLITRSM